MKTVIVLVNYLVPLCVDFIFIFISSMFFLCVWSFKKHANESNVN